MIIFVIIFGILYMLKIKKGCLQVFNKYIIIKKK